MDIVKVNAQIEMSPEAFGEMAIGKLNLNEAVMRNAENQRFNQFVNVKLLGNEKSINDKAKACLWVGVGAGAAVAMEAIGFVAFNIYKHIKDKNKRFFYEKLQKYVEEGKSGKITLNAIEELIDALGKLKLKKVNKLDIEASTMMEILNNMHDITQKMAKLNGISDEQIVEPSFSKEDNLNVFANYLIMQKSILLKKRALNM